MAQKDVGNKVPIYKLKETKDLKPGDELCANDFGYFRLNAKCNWKFAIENYCESYHLHKVHLQVSNLLLKP